MGGCDDVAEPSAGSDLEVSRRFLTSKVVTTTVARPNAQSQCCVACGMMPVCLNCRARAELHDFKLPSQNCHVKIAIPAARQHATRGFVAVDNDNHPGLQHRAASQNYPT